jgi:predicted transcriptional regulator of viral defense system
MITNADILNFAANNKQFTRKSLIDYLKKQHPSVSSNAVSMPLKRLLEKQELTRIELGVYAVVGKSKTVFSTAISDEIKQTSERIKQQFPFVNFCIWNSHIIASYTLHVPNIDFLLVDVERDAAESVFNFLNTNTSKRIFLTPSQTDFDRYITGSEVIIIRLLTSEAPLQTIETIPTPTIEKILVDIAGDAEFTFLQGAEIHAVYTNMFERHNVNTNKLLRYAARRGRKEKIQQLLKDTNL